MNERAKTLKQELKTQALQAAGSGSGTGTDNPYRHSVLEYAPADACDLGERFEDGSYDLVVEKCCIDALFCADDDHALRILMVLKEAFRVLRLGGVYVAISMHPPAQVEMFFRLPCFGWRFQYRQVEDKSTGGERNANESRSEVGNNENEKAPDSEAGRRKNYHYVYFCAKVDEKAMERNWESVLAAVERRPDEDPTMKNLPLEVRMHMH